MIGYAAAEKGTVELKKAAAGGVDRRDARRRVGRRRPTRRASRFLSLLTLKVDGEKVTGSSSSQLGTSPITSGTWKDGKLAIVLEGRTLARLR